MLATFGLDRVEASLDRDAISPAGVAEFLRQTTAGDLDTLARVGMGTTLRRAAELANEDPRPDVPTRDHIHHRPNSEFPQTRQADRV